MHMIDTKEILKLAVQAMEEKKGEQIKVLDISKVSVVADYFVIVNGNNQNQVQAISEEIQSKLTKEGIEPKHIEGIRHSDWVLLDYSDIVIHIFNKEDRLFYDLERIWKDGIVVEDVNTI